MKAADQSSSDGFRWVKEPESHAGAGSLLDIQAKFASH